MATWVAQCARVPEFSSSTHDMKLPVVPSDAAGVSHWSIRYSTPNPYHDCRWCGAMS